MISLMGWCLVLVVLSVIDIQHRLPTKSTHKKNERVVDAGKVSCPESSDTQNHDYNSNILFH